MSVQKKKKCKRDKSPKSFDKINFIEAFYCLCYKRNHNAPKILNIKGLFPKNND